MKQNQFEFKPFDQVLVRDNDNDTWGIEFYGGLSNECPDYPYRGIGIHHWAQCIPYNEETAHLVDTNKPYQPKVKEVTYEVTYGFGDNLTVESYTEEEFKNFISVAVCNNKDIKDFSVNIIIPD